MTIKEYKAMCAASYSKRNKYGAVKSGGYDSTKEHNRANELKMMQHMGLISKVCAYPNST